MTMTDFQAPKETRSIRPFLTTRMGSFRRRAIWRILSDAFQKELSEGTFKIGLKFRNIGSGYPRIKVYGSTDTEGSVSYLKDNQAAFAQVSGRDAVTLGEVTDGTPLLLPQDFWSAGNTKKCLLFEAAAEGKGELVMTINKSDGTQIGGGSSVWLDLKNVKNMYQRGKAQPENIAAPNGNVVGPFSGPMYWVPDPNGQPFPTGKPTDENDQAVIFVHGWSMDYNNYISFSETMFKRLWHAGFKGRFCTLRWDPLIVAEIFGQPASNGEYNRSEHRAWLYGESLKQFAQWIRNQNLKVSLIGHSMGNIVCGSALQNGFQAQNYLLMEAAVPAGCFDSGSSVNGYGRFLNAEQNEPTPDYHQAPNGDLTKGYRGFLSSISGNVAARVVNFRNRLDYALATGFKYGLEANWEKNQIDYKPDGNVSTDWHYHYYPNRTNLNERATQEFTFFVGRFVTDSYEMKSLVARPRSKAVGALEGASTAPNGIVDVDLEAAYRFDARDSDHGGQFNRRIQDVHDLYLTIVNVVQPPPQQ
jgi:pimeloyl-ACP methyl ester carboxylesterase